MHYYGAVYRPPSEAYSLIVQCTLGCSHNKCAFCNMYKDKKFSIRPVEEVLRDLAEARSYERRIERIFLADGDALILPMDYLLQVLDFIREYFPECTRVAAYATTKAALVGFTKALARELAPKNVRVNCICPGYVRTPLVDGMAQQSDPDDPERAIAAIASAVPLGRLGTPEECGELCAFLASSESSYLTGTQVVIDGGSTLPETSSMGQ